MWWWYRLYQRYQQHRTYRLNLQGRSTWAMLMELPVIRDVQK